MNEEEMMRMKKIEKREKSICPTQQLLLLVVLLLLCDKIIKCERARESFNLLPQINFGKTKSNQAIVFYWFNYLN